MKAFGWACFCLLLIASGAAADAYKDFNLGVAAASREEADAAIAALSRALSAQDLPSHLAPVGHLTRGREYLDSKQYDLAIADFTLALKLRPGYLEAYLSRCDAYSEEKQYALALSDCTKAVELDPANWRVRQDRIAVYLRMKDFERAAAEYAPFIAKRSREADLLLGRAEVYRQAGDFDKALADAAAAAQRAPDWGRAYVSLGLIQLARNDLSGMAESFESVTRKARRDPVAYLLDGQAEWANGKFDAAVESFEHSLDLDGQEKYSYLWLVMAASRIGAQPKPRYSAALLQTDLSSWPGPLLSLYLGKAAPEEPLKAHGSSRDTREGDRCSADFFVGEWYIAQHRLTDAKPLLQSTASDCATEWAYAKYAAIDLARLQ